MSNPESILKLDAIRNTKIPLNNGSDEIPALGFGTLILDPNATRAATRSALEAGFRQFDCAERYRNEEHVGDAMAEVFCAGRIRREEVLSGPSSGTTIIAPNASNRHSR